MSDLRKADFELESEDFLVLKSMLELAEKRMSQRQIMRLIDYLVERLEHRVQAVRAQRQRSDAA